MGNIAVRAEGLSKRYTRGLQKVEYYTLRETLLELVKAPFRRYRALSGSLPSDAGTFWALNDVSFEIKHGQVVAIAGPNGAGKSTLLRILSRITRPSKGLAHVYGSIGCLLEVGTGFHTELTGRENIYLSGAIRGMKKAEIRRKFDEIVDFSGIEDFLDTPVKRYSSGMYVRLAFSVAAHLEPDILLVDEVLAVGDHEFQKRCLRKMQDVAAAGRTVLFVSHNMVAMQRLCTSGLLLTNGTLQLQTSDMDALVQAYFGRGADSVPPSEWQNNGQHTYDNEWFVPSELYLGDKHGNKIRNPIPKNSDIWVHIRGEIKRLNPSLSIGYAAYCEDGQVVYWTYHTDGPPSKWPQLREGPCHLKSRIPPHFFNEGTYRLELLASIHMGKWLCKPGSNSPEIFLAVKGGLSDSPLWLSRRPGILGPIIEWVEM